MPLIYYLQKQTAVSSQTMFIKEEKHFQNQTFLKKKKKWILSLIKTIDKVSENPQ